MANKVGQKEISNVSLSFEGAGEMCGKVVIWVCGGLWRRASHSAPHPIGLLGHDKRCCSRSGHLLVKNSWGFWPDLLRIPCKCNTGNAEIPTWQKGQVSNSLRLQTRPRTSLRVTLRNAAPSAWRKAGRAPEGG